MLAPFPSLRRAPPTSLARLGAWSLPLVAGLALGGCAFFQSLIEEPAKKPVVVERPITVRSLSETMNVTAVAAAEPFLWVGTPMGLVKWDIKTLTMRAQIGRAEGLPGDRVDALAPDGQGGMWVLTPGGLAHESKGAWRNSPAVPVGAFVTGLVQAPDATLWASGPDGLARLKKDKWERYLGQTSVTSLLVHGNEIWVGTDGRGVVRVVGDKAEVFGPEQGCATEVVRGLANTPWGVVAVGEGASGPRLSSWDGKRFWSYSVESPGAVIEWVRHIGNDTLLAAGGQIYSLGLDGESDPGGLTLTALPATVAKAPESVPAKGELPAKMEAPKADEKPATAATPTPAGAKPADPKAAQAPEKKDDKELAKKSNEGSKKAGPAPKLVVKKWGAQPDGVTAVGPEGMALYVGTRFLGADRLEEGGKDLPYRTGDLAQDAIKLSVACEPKGACYVATGGPRAWRFDGKVFDRSQVDPEPGSHVLAVVQSPQGAVLAIHRGAKDPVLRMSTVSDGTWAPIAVTEVKVPDGVPDVTFARYAPSGKLWLGLRYLDRVGDGVDFGAAEVDVDQGKVIYHRQVGAQAASAESQPTAAEMGVTLPNNMEAAFFRSDDEAWFGTRSGAVRLKGGQTTLYTENDGLESEYIHDVIEGPDDRIWVATSRGIGRFDGARWQFPVAGDPLRVKATSMARDKKGGVYIGYDGGVMLLRAPKQPGQPPTMEKFTTLEGLLDNRVIALSVDRDDRVWALTEKGLTILERQSSAP